MDAFKNSVSIKYKEGQKKKERKNTNPLDTLIETDLTHSSHNPHTILTQSSHVPPTIPTQSSHVPPTNPHTILTQSSHKNDDIPDLHNLSRMSMKIMQYIFEICVNSGNRITPRLRHNNIAEALNLNSKSVPNTISRMVKDKFISRNPNKNGDNRGTQYIISEHMYQKMVILTQSSHVPPTKSHTKPHTKDPSRRSYINNIKNRTTTNNMEFENFFKNLQELNPSILLNSQNVRKNEILNIYNARSSITPEEFVNSLEDFCYDIENGILKNITIPRSLFVKIMKMENYESEIRVKKDTEIIEQQRIRKDKAKQDLLEKQIELFPDEYDKALKSWINSLSNNDYKDLFGIEKDSPYFLNKDRMIEAKFHEIEWPNIFKSLNS